MKPFVVTLIGILLVATLLAIADPPVVSISGSRAGLSSVWTNNNGTIQPITLISSNVLRFVTTNQVSPIGNGVLLSLEARFDDSMTNNSSFGLATGDGGISGAGGSAIGGSLTTTLTGEGAGLFGKGVASFSINYGVVGLASPLLVDGRTNIGVYGISVPFGSSGYYVGGFFGAMADNSKWTFPNITQGAALIADSFDMGVPEQVWRTSNGVVKATMQGGILLNNGLLIHSNTLSIIPTLAKGDVFLYSTNGVLWSINCNQAGTLTTNKLSP